MKAIYRGLTSLLFVGLIIGFIACQKDKSQEPTDAPTHAQKEQVFAYAQDLKITDDSGNFFVIATIRSNNRENIEEFINMRPSIRVYSGDLQEPTGSDVLNLEDGSNASKTSTDVDITFTEDQNIPEGHAVKLFFLSGDNVTSLRAESYRTYSFTNDLAKKAKTTVYGKYQMKWTYYSRGCCSYSIGWYNRGYITHYGPNYSYTFSASKYTTYAGVKCSAYTTLSAINTCTVDFYY